MRTKPKIEIDLARVEELASQGLTQQQIADALGIGTNTLYTRKRESVDFADAIKRGQARGVAFVSNALMDLVKNGNTAATIFYLKCRGGWQEVQKVDMTSSDRSMSPALPDIKSLPPEKIDALVDRAYGEKDEP